MTANVRDRALTESEAILFKKSRQFLYQLVFRLSGESIVSGGLSGINEMLWSLRGDIHRGGEGGRRPANLTLRNNSGEFADAPGRQKLEGKEFAFAVNFLERKVKFAKQPMA